MKFSEIFFLVDERRKMFQEKYNDVKEVAASTQQQEEILCATVDFEYAVCSMHSEFDMYTYTKNAFDR